MDVILLSVLIGLVAVLLIVVIVLVFLQIRKPRGSMSDLAATLQTLNQHVQQGSIGDLSTTLQNLNQSVQHSQTQAATMSEKLSHLESLPQTITNLQVELRGLGERIVTVEQHQNTANQGLNSLALSLTQTGSNITAEVGKAQQQATMLAESVAAVRDDLIRAKENLTELQASARARHDIEQLTANSVRRLEAVIAGTQAKGAAGENILEAVFAKLPAEWQVRNFKVAGKAVEFGLRLPNNLILPIDSKWAATSLLE